MWKFNTFSAAQILREINSGECRSPKCAFLLLSEAQNSDFSAFEQFSNATIKQIQTSESLKLSKLLLISQ